MKKAGLAVLIAMAACRKETLPPAVPAAPPAAQSAPAMSHEQEILAWRAKRLARLKADDGWLTLVGLTWLNEGENVVKLPSKPPIDVKMTLQKGAVTLHPAARAALLLDGKPLSGPLVMVNDMDRKGPTIVQHGTLRFHVIKRADRYGIRMRDTGSDARAHFKGLDYFPVNPEFKVTARFEPFQPPRHIPIANVLGMTTDEVSPGVLVFTLGGREFRLQPILEQGETDYFIIFKDATSGKETYPAARYLYAAPPGPGGTTVIDFNKAYNPPCAFTPFATCPLPPPQNRLPIRVEAGEKTYGH